MISDQAFDVLRTTSLFAGFTDEQLEMVPKVALPRTFAPGDTLIEEGSTETRSLFLLVEGEVAVIVGGEEHAVLEPGTHFGEMSLLTGEPRSATVVARTAATALELSHRHLEGLIASNPKVALDMLAELARRLRRATQTLAAMTEASPEAAQTARRLGVHSFEDVAPGVIELAMFLEQSGD